MLYFSSCNPQTIRRKMKKKRFSLRERKYAKTKIALTNAFVDRLKSVRFNDISIKEVCVGVDVSEGTFYNYFPSKLDLIYYYQQLSSLKLFWETERRVKTDDPLEKIDVFFDVIAGQISQPYLFYELVSILTGEKRRLKSVDISVSERTCAFPDCEGIEDIPQKLPEEFFRDNLEGAVKRGILSPQTDTEEIVVFLITIMVGVPLAVPEGKFSTVGRLYRRHLDLLWKGIGRIDYVQE